MIRGVVLSVCLAGAVAIRSPTTAERAQSSWSCGNCYYFTTINGVQLRRCNTGNADDTYPFSRQAATDGETAPQDQLNINGFSNATALTVADMRSLITQRANGNANAWNTLFCSSYLNLYRFSGTTDNGAACVRGATAEEIIQADTEVRNLYFSLGTENGYPSSYAVVNGQNLTTEAEQFGTDGEGDIPTNWCSIYMRNMLCHAAFPQVLKTAADIASARTTNNGVDEARGQLRPVDIDSCNDLFRSCNRREPTDDETKGSYVLPALNNVRALTIEGSRSEIENARDNVLLCDAWAKGYGLAQAGTGVTDNTDSNVQSVTITFSSSSRATVSMLMAVVAVLALLF